MSENVIAGIRIGQVPTSKKEPFMSMSKSEIAEFLAVRKAEGLKIDPNTAEVDWEYGQCGDPYGVYDIVGEAAQIGRTYFARAPGSSIWVEFGDLPASTRDALWKAHKHELAFPAGLPLLRRDDDPC
jgi:hypothetical protein